MQCIKTSSKLRTGERAQERKGRKIVQLYMCNIFFFALRSSTSFFFSFDLISCTVYKLNLMSFFYRCCRHCCCRFFVREHLCTISNADFRVYYCCTQPRFFCRSLPHSVACTQEFQRVLHLNKSGVQHDWLFFYYSLQKFINWICCNKSLCR